MRQLSLAHNLPDPGPSYKLHQALPRSKLDIVERAGHSGSEPTMEKALVEAIALF